MASLTEKQVHKALSEALQRLDGIRRGFRRNIEYNIKGDAYAWDPRRDDLDLLARQKAVGRAIGRILAMRGKGNQSGHFNRTAATEYAILDAALGFKVERESKLTKREAQSGYLSFIVGKHAGSWNFKQYWRDAKIERSKEPVNLGFVGCKPFYAPKQQPFNVIREYLIAKADVEYWQEIERLMGERAAMKQTRLALRKAA